MSEALTPSDFWQAERERQREEVARQRKAQHVTGIPRLAALRSGIDPERVRSGIHHCGRGWKVDIQGVTDAERHRYRIEFRLGAIALGYGGDVTLVTVRGV